MDFTLTKQQEMMRTLMQKFAANEVEPLAATLDIEERHPYETVEKMARYGIMGTPIPKEYGGAGGDYMSYIIAVEELAKVCASTADILSTHVSLCCGPIMTYGTEEQKQKYLVPLAKGDLLGGFALTEPNAGTDASGQQTVAKLEGDHYVINGSKIFITNGGVADVYVMFCMTDKSKGTKGISAFIIEKDFPGFSIGKKEEKMGLRGSNTAELVFTDMIVPKENLLGQEGRGFNIAMATLDGGRIGIGAQALGIAEGAL
ncbi:MAG: acyl-CoA dehydrogenase family protein, partial [Christensenellaceae bacterium]|nr:acyl-CoA dehydrogenase family protein [Christensenellaceae bacterium]